MCQSLHVREGVLLVVYVCIYVRVCAGEKDGGNERGRENERKRMRERVKGREGKREGGQEREDVCMCGGAWVKTCSKTIARRRRGRIFASRMCW